MAQNEAVHAAELVIENVSSKSSLEDEDRHSEEEELSHNPELQEDVTSIEEQLERLDIELHPVLESPPSAEHPAPSSGLFDNPSDFDDGEGEWITPSNVGLHKARALDLLPDSGIAKGKRKGGNEVVDTGCMTADFAMQNVLLQMGLNLIGVEGKRIEKVKSWVLRCHACFKYVP